MEKIIQPWGWSNGDPTLFQVVNRDMVRYGREKIASCGIHPDVMNFVDEEVGKSHPLDDRFIYIIASNMGAGETWGSNVNADRFLRQELAPRNKMWGTQTFLDAGIFKHHVNKDKKKSYGDIIYVTFAPAPLYMDRVESVVAIDRERAAKVGAEDVCDRIDRGEFPSWSMGARVKYDVCTFCGNKAKTRKDYCVHMRKYPNVILTAQHLRNPDFKGMQQNHIGLRVCVDNPRPRFFDFSQVWVGAAAEAKTLLKVAHGNVLLSADIADMIIKESSSKSAAIRKQIPGDDPSSPEGKSLAIMSSKEPDIPKDILNTLGGYGLPKALSTLTGMGMVLKPREFQRIVLVSRGNRAAADDLDRAGHVFAPSSACSSEMHRNIAYKNFVRGAAHILLSMVAPRSAFGPVLRVRMARYVSKPVEKVQVKEASTPELNKIAELYNGYRLAVLEKMSGIGTSAMFDDSRVRDAVYGNVVNQMMTGVVKEAEPVVGKPSMLYAMNAHDLNVPELQKSSSFASHAIRQAARAHA